MSYVDAAINRLKDEAERKAATPPTPDAGVTIPDFVLDVINEKAAQRYSGEGLARIGQKNAALFNRSDAVDVVTNNLERALMSLYVGADRSLADDVSLAVNGAVRLLRAEATSLTAQLAAANAELERALAVVRVASKMPDEPREKGPEYMAGFHRGFTGCLDSVRHELVDAARTGVI